MCSSDLFMDPFGTWAMVGTPRLYNSGTIASLDALISGGTPFADIARNWETDINNEYGDDFKGVQIDRKASLGSAGVFEIANPSYFAGMARVHARTYALAGRLFYIVVPICSKGLKDAYISIDEKWKQEVFDGHKWTDISPVDHGTYTHGMNLVWALRLGDFMRVGTLRQPIEENGVTYDKVIILGDAPHVSSTLDAVPMLQIDKFIQKLTVNATLSVKSNYADMGGRITKVDVLRAKYKFVVGHNENGGLIDQKVQWQ